MWKKKGPRLRHGLCLAPNLKSSPGKIIYLSPDPRLHVSTQAPHYLFVLNLVPGLFHMGKVSHNAGPRLKTMKKEKPQIMQISQIFFVVSKIKVDKQGK